MLKKALIALGILAIIGVLLARPYIANNVALDKKKYLYIPTGAKFETVISKLEEGKFLNDISSFESLAKRMNYDQKVKAGRYEILPGTSNWSLVRMLRSGDQKPVQLVLRKFRFKEDLVRKVCSNLETDSIELMALLNDNAKLLAYNLDSNTSLSAFTPNTYEFYWNSNATKVFDKIASTYKKYWSEENTKRAAAKNLTPAQVMTLASIVEEETNKEDEKDTIASVYLNRLRIRMPLQADPTCKYAAKDFSIKRVLKKHTEIASPYNTYYVNGLPLGPICTPSKSSIEAVLNAPRTDYLFFCASETLRPYHNFASTLAAHEINAKKFQAALNQKNIMK
jgi:UPF0755 protein